MKLEIKLDFDHGAWSDEEIKEAISDNLGMIPKALRSGEYCTDLDYEMWRDLIDKYGEVVGKWRVYK